MIMRNRFATAADANLMSRWDTGESRPLFVALRDGESSVDVIRRIVTDHPEILVQQTENGLLPLHCALSDRPNNLSLDTLRFIVEKCPEVLREKDKTGRLPLHQATRSSISTLQFLVEQYPDGLQIKSSEGELPLHIAVKFRDSSIAALRFLVEKYPEGLQVKNNDGNLPLHIAGKCQRLDLTVAALQFLVEKYPEGLQIKNNDGNLPLHIVGQCQNQDSTVVAAVRFLVEQYNDGLRQKNNDGRLPLHSALSRASRVSKEIIEFLVEKFPESVREKDNEGSLPLHLASLNERAPLGVLIDRFPEGVRLKDNSGSLPLHFAVQARISGVARWFVELFPESARVKDNDGYLPIHRAARAASLDLIQFMVEQFPQGVREKTHEHGYLPLHIALTVGTMNKATTKIVLFLVDQFPESVSIKDNLGYLPLHHAVASSCTTLTVVRFLVKRFPQGVREITLDHGYLPLHLAIGRKNLEHLSCPIMVKISQLLLKKFPESAGIKDSDGYLPLHRAVQAFRPFITFLNQVRPYSSCLDLVRCLVEQFPQGLREKTLDHGSLSLHLALDVDEASEGADDENYATEVSRYLIRQFPESVKVKDNYGYLPLHHAAGNPVVTLNFVQFLVEQFPQGLGEKTLDHGYLPLHLTFSIIDNRYSKKISKYLVEQFPESARVKDNAGYLPLHRAVGHRYASLDVVQCLVEHFRQGLQEKTLDLGYLPLHLAVDKHELSRRWMEISQFLVEQCPLGLQEKTHDGSLPVLKIAEAAAATVRSWDGLPQSDLPQLQLRLIYLCVRLYPNFLF